MPDVLSIKPFGKKMYSPIIHGVNIKMNTDEFLVKTATEIIEQNSVETSKGCLLTAGSQQCSSVWVRDFCYSSKALQKMGKSHLTFNLIKLYVSETSKNKYDPIKVFDSINPEHRYYYSSINRLFKMELFRVKKLNKDDELQSYIYDSRSSKAFDSHLLILLAFHHCSDDEKHTLWDKYKHHFIQMIAWYEPYICPKTNLIYQESFSTWKDSLTKKGYYFMTNLLFCEVVKRFMFLQKTITSELLTRQKLRQGENKSRTRPIMTKENKSAEQQSFLRKLNVQLIKSFQQKSSKNNNSFNLFKTMLGDENHVSLEGNLFVLLWHTHDECPYEIFLNDEDRYDFFVKLKKHPLWKGNVEEVGEQETDCFCLVNRNDSLNKNTGFPGFATYPNFSSDQVSWQVKLAGLSSYHSSMYWSWLMALSGEVVTKMAFLVYKHPNKKNSYSKCVKLSNEIWNNLTKIVKRDKSVHEIYFHDGNFTPFESILYKSEPNFSWGASYIMNFWYQRMDLFNEVLEEV